MQFGLAILEFVSCQVACSVGGVFSFIILATCISDLWLECRCLVKNNIFKNQIMFYRELQIFEKILDSCIRGRIFLTFALFSPLLQIMACFAMIKILLDGGNLYIIAIFVMIYIVMLLLTLLIFSTAAQISKITTTWIAKGGRIFQR